MKKNRKLINPMVLVLFTLFLSTFTSAQSDKTIVIGNETDFSATILNAKKNAVIELTLPDNQSISLSVGTKNFTSKDEFYIHGPINNHNQSSFSYSKLNNKIKGDIILLDAKKGFEFFTSESNILSIRDVDINKLICLDYKKIETANSTKTKTNRITRLTQPIFNSLPGAVAVIYLDFDGEVVSGTRWNSQYTNGETINAEPFDFTDEQIKETWAYTAEDFSAFNVNVTTDRAAYDNAPENKRMMCIYTTTSFISAGGIAYPDSFSDGFNNPCWVWNPYDPGITASHELGHTVGLAHDGQDVTGGSYYIGDRDISTTRGHWGPIMGNAKRCRVAHWSKGEYTEANNQEDDLSVITSEKNFGYRVDDHSGAITNATALIVNASGEVLPNDNNGIIARNDDVDVFSFQTLGGPVSFNFEPYTLNTNLNIEAKIFNASGDEVTSSSPPNQENAEINTNLEAGTYYIQIDGVAGESSSGGYTNYGSIGAYSISGSINSTLSVSDFIKNNLNIFPNPVNNDLTIVKNTGIDLMSAKINDVNGRVIKVIDLFNTVEQRVTVSELSTGIYFMTIYSRQGQGTLKIVKQ